MTEIPPYASPWFVSKVKDFESLKTSLRRWGEARKLSHIERQIGIKAEKTIVAE